MAKYTLRKKYHFDPVVEDRSDRFAWEEGDVAFEEVAEKRFDPGQPRIPAGQPGGGRWTTGGGGGVISFMSRDGKEITVDPKDSLYPHLERQADGSYRLSAKRQALHDEIVRRLLTGATPVANPTMYMTGGGPASGKSTMLESGMIGDFPTNAVSVNADYFKERLPEYYRHLKNDPRQAAARVHTESSLIADRTRAAARAASMNVIYDTTGNSTYDKLKKKVDSFRDRGYRIEAHYATLDTDLAVKIANIRGEKTGRYVPEFVVRNTHASVSRTLDTAFQNNLFDSVNLYDTNVQGRPRLVASGTRSSFEVHNRTLYADFLAKADTRRRSDTELDTHQLERVLVEAVLGMEPSMTSSAAKVAREAIDAELAALPDDAEIIIGKEYPEHDWSYLYDNAFDEAPTQKSAPEHDGEGIANQQYVAIKGINDEKQIVYGEVYAPDVLDTYGEFMSAEDIEVMAHRFMQIDLRTAIDTNHDNIPNGAYPVESFVAREGDPDYTPGSWVLGVKIPDAGLWRKVKTGELNGFSFQSLVKPTSVEVEYAVLRDSVGKTESHDDHEHVYLVELDEIGNVVRGVTSKAADGHFHEITRASHTEESEGHSHRFFL